MKKIELGEPDLDNFRKNIDKMKESSGKFAEEREKAHAFTDDVIDLEGLEFIFDWQFYEWLEWCKKKEVK